MGKNGFGEQLFSLFKTAMADYCIHAGWGNLPPDACRGRIAKRWKSEFLALAVSDHFEKKMLQKICKKNATRFATKLNRRQAAMMTAYILDGESDENIRRAIYSVS